MNLIEEDFDMDTSADLNNIIIRKRPRSEIHNGRQYERTRPLLKRRDSILNSSIEPNEIDIEMTKRESRSVELHSELLFYLVNRRHRDIRFFYR